MAISDIKVTKTSIKYTGASSTRRYGVPADAISVPADSAAAVVKFAISIRRESCTNAKAKYSSSVVPPDPSVHFYHCFWGMDARADISSIESSRV